MMARLIAGWLACALPWSAEAAPPAPAPAEMIVYTADRSCPGILEIEEVRTDRWQWTRAWLSEMDEVIRHHITLPVLVMAPLTALAAPADVAAAPFRHGVVSVKGRINASIVGSGGAFRVLPDSLGRACGADGAGGFHCEFEGAFAESDFFEMHFGPPLGHAIRIARGRDGRITARTADTDRMICELRFRLPKIRR